jgi:hypothetical protein
MRGAGLVRWLLMLALLLVAPIPLYLGFVAPGLLSPFVGLSEGATRIGEASGVLVAALWVAALGLTLARRLGLALKVLALAVPVQVSTFALVLVGEPVFRTMEQEEKIQERFEVAAATYAVQVWCNGGFAYLRQEEGETGYDVMVHLPPSEGEFALRVGQFRVTDELRTCDASVFDARYAVARAWFDACDDTRAAFEALVDRVRQPPFCPHPVIVHWPKVASPR